MKFAAVAPTMGRGAVREKQKRDRAAAPRLRTRFPDLHSLRVEFEFSDRTEFLPSPQVTVFHPPAPAYFCFTCPYSDCDGQFDLTNAIDLTVSDRKPHSDGQLRCAGTRHGGIPCTLCLEYSVSAHWS